MAYLTKRCIGSVARMHNDNPPSQFVDSWAQMLLYSQQQLCGKHEYIHYLPPDCLHAPSSYHEQGRNTLVAMAEGEWLYQTDTDHQFAPDILVRLMRLRAKYNSPVISGTYVEKQPPHGLVARLWGPGDEIIRVAGWEQGDDVIGNMDLMVGGGCLLVERWVFKAIIEKLGQQPFDVLTGPPTRYSEDFAFCKRCRDLKIPVHLAVNVEAHHLMQSRIPLHAKDFVRVVPREPRENPNEAREVTL